MSPDLWQEVAYVGITPVGGTAMQFRTIIENISDVDVGDKDVEGVATIAGGRLAKFTPQADATVTMDIYEVGVGGNASANGMAQLFHTVSADYDTTQPLSVTNNIKRDKFQVALLFTEDDDRSPDTAEGSCSGNSYRMVMKNAYITSLKRNYSDKAWKATVTFKCPPFTKAGVGNITEQESDSGTVLAALAAYTA